MSRNVLRYNQSNSLLEKDSQLNPKYTDAMEQARHLIARQAGQLSALVEDLLNLPLEATEVPSGPGSTVNANVRPVLALPRPDVVRGGLAAWQLKRVLDYIKNNLAEPIKVTDVASVTRLSPCHFARAFKRSFGLSVHLYLMCRRIVLAQQLRVNTYDPLGEIALICGMHDQPHFTRWFRRVVGETPNRWRHAHQNIPAPNR